jgi:hypothetical protein
MRENFPPEAAAGTRIVSTVTASTGVPTAVVLVEDTPPPSPPAFSLAEYLAGTSDVESSGAGRLFFPSLGAVIY